MSAPLDAALAASLLAVDPGGLGGVCLRSLVQPARTLWLDMLRDLLPDDAPVRRIPFNIADGRLLGGLDLVATLRARRPVAERGALAATNGGVVILTMAERLSAHTTALFTSVLDAGEVVMKREGVDIADAARIGVVALDESIGDDERVPSALLDRLAFLVDLTGYDLRTLLVHDHESHEVAAARRLLARVAISADVVAAICGTGMALGAGSPRVALLALRAAKALAALDGRTLVDVDDATTAARLVFAPRATQLPTESDQRQPDQPQPQPDSGAQPSAEEPPETTRPEAPSTVPATSDALQDQVLAATTAAIPVGLLSGLRAEARSRSKAAGRAGALYAGGARGRPAGVRSGAPQGQSRLNVMETLRAAAPWQRLRGRSDAPDMHTGRVHIDPADFRVTRYQQRSPTLTIFTVDASGSSALNRLAETKGAVELLLADCYVRRDQVAVISFRGRARRAVVTTDPVPGEGQAQSRRNARGRWHAARCRYSVRNAASHAVATARRNAHRGTAERWPGQRDARWHRWTRAGPGRRSADRQSAGSNPYRGFVRRHITPTQRSGEGSRRGNGRPLRCAAIRQCPFTVERGDRGGTSRLIAFRPSWFASAACPRHAVVRPSF